MKIDGHFAVSLCSYVYYLSFLPPSYSAVCPFLPSIFHLPVYLSSFLRLSYLSFYSFFFLPSPPSFFLSYSPLICSSPSLLFCFCLSYNIPSFLFFFVLLSFVLLCVLFFFVLLTSFLPFFSPSIPFFIASCFFSFHVSLQLPSFLSPDPKTLLHFRHLDIPHLLFVSPFTSLSPTHLTYFPFPSLPPSTHL